MLNFKIGGFKAWKRIKKRLALKRNKNFLKQCSVFNNLNIGSIVNDCTCNNSEILNITLVFTKRRRGRVLSDVDATTTYTGVNLTACCAPIISIEELRKMHPDDVIEVDENGITNIGNREKLQNINKTIDVYFVQPRRMKIECI